MSTLYEQKILNKISLQKRKKFVRKESKIGINNMSKQIKI